MTHIQCSCITCRRPMVLSFLDVQWSCKVCKTAVLRTFPDPLFSLLSMGPGSVIDLSRVV